VQVLPNRNGLSLNLSYVAVGATSRAINDNSLLHVANGSQRRSIMRLYCLAALTLLIILQPAPRAFAFSTDPTSGVNSDGTPRFMDPDEQVHSFFFGGSNLSEDGWFDRNSVSRNAVPSTDPTNQGITFPNLFFPTPTHR
jgi:hypothetical protein